MRRGNDIYILLIFLIEASSSIIRLFSVSTVARASWVAAEFSSEMPAEFSI